MHYQTFSPEENMLLDSIAVKHGFPHNTEERTIKLKLYKGSGVAGTLLAEANNSHRETRMMKMITMLIPLADRVFH